MEKITNNDDGTYGVKYKGSNLIIRRDLEDIYMDEPLGAYVDMHGKHTLPIEFLELSNDHERNKRILDCVGSKEYNGKKLAFAKGIGICQDCTGPNGTFTAYIEGTWTDSVEDPSNAAINKERMEERKKALALAKSDLDLTNEEDKKKYNSIILALYEEFRPVNNMIEVKKERTVQEPGMSGISQVETIGVAVVYQEELDKHKDVNVQEQTALYMRAMEAINRWGLQRLSLESINGVDVTYDHVCSEYVNDGEYIEEFLESIADQLTVNDKGVMDLQVEGIKRALSNAKKDVTSNQAEAIALQAKLEDLG